MSIIYYGWHYRSYETPPQLKLDTGFLDWCEVYAVKMGLIAPPKTADWKIKFDYLDKVRKSRDSSGISIGFNTITDVNTGIETRRYYLAAEESIKYSGEKPVNISKLFEINPDKITKWNKQLADFCQTMDIPAQTPFWYLAGDYQDEYLPQGGY